jgi:hypothetical protein
MKLNPPASSSDLEAAREIARRLHVRRRPEDDEGFAGLETPSETASRPPAKERPFPPSPPPRVATIDEVPVPPPPPAWDAPLAEVAPRDEPLGDLADLGAPSVLAEAPPLDEPLLPDVEVDAGGVSPEELVGSAEPAASLEDRAEPEAPPSPLSPFEIDLDDPGTAEEDVVGAAALPSWDDIVERCLGLSQASAAMLVDPAGQVFAAHGDWPAPGPETIAAKLVSTMERTLKDAPTRSISAPLTGRHLTAWRVPLTEGLVTIAFLGDAPVRTEVRPAIDTEIHRGAGA